MFMELLKTDITPGSAEIIHLIIKRNPKFITSFMKYTKNSDDIFQQKSFIFSILSHNLNYQWSAEFLNKLYEHYKPDIIFFLTEMKTDQFSWLIENTDAAALLIDNTFGK